MKIVFLGFASSFTPGMTYHDNMLCDQTIKDGHDVVYLGNPECFVDGKLQDIGPQDTVLPNGLRLIRLPYVKCGSDFLTKKLRKFRGVYDILEREKPDVVYCHSTQYGPVLDAAKYKKNHSNVKFYVDSHADPGNSGKNIVSLYILHRIYYRHLNKKIFPYVDKYFYINEYTKNFAIQNYGVPVKLMEYYPLGGTVLSDDEYQNIRQKRRNELGIKDDQKLYMHSGKLDALKKTESLLEAYIDVKDDSRMIIIGSIPEDQKPIILPLIEKDSRISYLGWKSGAELNEYLCACDLYCQPGSGSATMQNAICRNCAVMAYPYEAYKIEFDSFNNISWVKDNEDIKDLFVSLREHPEKIETLKHNSHICATKLLDYRKLASRIYC